MFAIDGVKLPSNADKAKSGTRADFVRQAARWRRRRCRDAGAHRDERCERGRARSGQREERQRSSACSAKRRRSARGLQRNPEDRRGAKGSIRKSNRTDNESAKMATGKGVIQGYTGVAAVDGKHQVIVEAQAHGTGLGSKRC